MEKIRRPTGWDIKAKRTSVRITKRKKDIMLREYEEKMARGKNRDDILEKLAEKYGKDTRTVERYLHDAREAQKIERSNAVAATSALEKHWEELAKLAGHDIEIEPPVFVPLDIIMTVCVHGGYFKDKVKQALLETFSSRDLPGGKRGFFHPDNFTFGQPVYLSQVIDTAMQVPGVKWVDLKGEPNRFQRWGEAAHHEVDDGQIAMERLEIARLDNNPSAPENGKIEFIMEGGL